MSPFNTIGFICNRQNSGFESLLMFTANSISTGQPSAFLPMDSISLDSSENGIVSHFKTGANETIRDPLIDRLSFIVPSSCEITLPDHFNEPSFSATFKS